MFSGFVGIILIFFIPYTASGFKAVGTLFNSLFGFDYHVSMIAGAAIIIGYTVLGGFLAVSTTDLIQSVVMSIALIIIVFFGIHVAGGWDAVISNAQSLCPISIGDCKLPIYLAYNKLADKAIPEINRFIQEVKEEYCDASGL